MSQLANSKETVPAHACWADFNELIPALRRYAWALVRRDHFTEPDDLVQECLMHAWTKRFQFVAGSNLRAWLFTILHNNYVNSVRRAATQQKNQRLTEPTVEQVSSAPLAEQQMQLQALQVAIDKLPEGQRAVVLLVAVEGLSYKDVAAVTQTPIGTVRSRLSRAREALDEAMSHSR